MKDDLPPIKPINLNYKIGTVAQRRLLIPGSSPLTVLGEDTSTGERITVDDEMRERGMYVVGVQGTGKSSFLEALIHQDICKGYSVIVIDPHGDLVDHVIEQLPENRVKDTYLLDIEDTKYPFGINLFSTPGDLSMIGQTLAVERIMHVFDRVFPASARMLLDKYLENIALVFLENPGHTMVDIPRFLSDEQFRRSLTIGLKNTYVKDFWEEFNNLPPGRRREEVAALTNRLNSFLNKPLVRNIVGQKSTTIDFRLAIQRGEILLIRLPVKKLKTIASLIGTMLVAQIHAATFSFANKPRSKRPGFSLFVDEFQNFSTLDFAELFTEARKYRARQTVAHQFTKQLTLEELKEATTTAYTIVAFKTTEHDARLFASTFSDLELYPGVQHIYRDVLPRLKHHKSGQVNNFWAQYVRKWEAADEKSIREKKEVVEDRYSKETYTREILPERDLGHGIVGYRPEWVRASLDALEDLLVDTQRRKQVNDRLKMKLLYEAAPFLKFSNYYNAIYAPTEEEQQGDIPDKAMLQAIYHDKFVSALDDLLEALIEEPIGERKETTVQDVAMKLHHLPNYTALVHVGTETHFMKPPPIPDNAVKGEAVWQRKRTIQVQTGKKYCRKRSEIEQELTQRTQYIMQVTQKQEQDHLIDTDEQSERPRFEDVDES